MSKDARAHLSGIKDTRDDGISYEANRTKISINLENTYQGKNDFSPPGRHLFEVGLLGQAFTQI